MKRNTLPTTLPALLAMLAAVSLTAAAFAQAEVSTADFVQKVSVSNTFEIDSSKRVCQFQC